MENYRPYVAMVAMQLAYAGSNILMKIALERGLNQLVFVIYRHIIAQVLLFPFAYVLERKERPSMSISSMAKIFVLSFLGSTVHLNVYYAGIKYTSPTVASALSNIIPSLTIIMAVLLRMEKVKLGSASGNSKVVGTIICIGGSLVFTFWKGENIFKGTSGDKPVIQMSSDGHESWVKGSLLILTSYIAWSAWLIMQAMVYKIYPAARLSLTIIICFFATLQSAFLALFWGRDPEIWKIGWNVQLWTILYCGIVISAFVYYLQMWCISRKGPVFAAMFSPLLLVFVGIFSAIAFGERLHLGSLVGAVIIILGLYAVLWGKRKDVLEQQEHRTVTSGGGDDAKNKATDVPPSRA